MKKIFAGVFLLGVVVLLTGCDQKDNCLDAGGSYDSQTQSCQK